MGLLREGEVALPGRPPFPTAACSLPPVMPVRGVTRGDQEGEGHARWCRTRNSEKTRDIRLKKEEGYVSFGATVEVDRGAEEAGNRTWFKDTPVFLQN